MLWNDANANGRWDGIEPVLPRWTVFIDQNESGTLDSEEPSTVSGDDGFYRFTGLEPGEHVIQETMPERWDQTYPGVTGANDEPQGHLSVQFTDAGFVQAGGADIQALEYSVPVLVDWNNDGLDDLLLGEKVGSHGKIRLYLNEGSAAQPAFGGVSFIQASGADLTVPAAGCLGVFPRVVDWNADGRKDLLLGLTDGRVQVLLNVNTDDDPRLATGFYVPAGPLADNTDIDVGARATVDLVDWNADGRPDLIVGALDGRVRVLKLRIS